MNQARPDSLSFGTAIPLRTCPSSSTSTGALFPDGEAPAQVECQPGHVLGGSRKPSCRRIANQMDRAGGQALHLASMAAQWATGRYAGFIVVKSTRRTSAAGGRLCWPRNAKSGGQSTHADPHQCPAPGCS